jgi:hypothetical protein
MSVMGSTLAIGSVGSKTGLASSNTTRRLIEAGVSYEIISSPNPTILRNYVEGLTPYKIENEKIFFRDVLSQRELETIDENDTLVYTGWLEPPGVQLSGEQRRKLPTNLGGHNTPAEVMIANTNVSLPDRRLIKKGSSLVITGPSITTKSRPNTKSNIPFDDKEITVRTKELIPIESDEPELGDFVSQTGTTTVTVRPTLKIQDYGEVSVANLS